MGRYCLRAVNKIFRKKERKNGNPLFNFFSHKEYKPKLCQFYNENQSGSITFTKYLFFFFLFFYKYLLCRITIPSLTLYIFFRVLKIVHC